MRSTIEWIYVADAGTPSDPRDVHIAVRCDDGTVRIGMGWYDGTWRDAADADDLGTSVYAYGEVAAVPPVRPLLAQAA